MHTKWLHGLDQIQKDELELNYKQSILIRERLVEILNKEIERCSKDMRKEDNLKLPNLAEYYTGKVSEQRAYQGIIDLIK